MSISRYRFVQSILCAHLPTFNVDGSGNTWFCQRDESQNFAPLEEILKHRSHQLLFSPLHASVTLDDGCLGTRAADDPVKTISAPKAYKERNCKDVVADVHFRHVIRVHFRRGDEKMMQAVGQVVYGIFDGRGEMSCIVTADRGYEKPAIAYIFLVFGMSAFFVTWEKL